MGLSESQNCLEGSCHVCHVHLRNLGESIYDSRLRPLRTNEDFRNVLQHNNMQIGRAVDNNSRMHMEQNGIDHVSAMVLMPGCDNYDIVAQDIMHSLALGEHGEVISQTEKVFATNIVVIHGSTALADLTKEYYRRLSKIFRSCYTSLNLGKVCNDIFANFNQWKGLHAHGISIFMEAVPFILLKLNLVNFMDDANVQSFTQVVLLSQIGQIASKHRISATDLYFLERKIPTLLTLLDAEGRSRINSHLLLHLPDYIRLMGVPRDYWGMAYEMKHGYLKKLFSNVNNNQISESVFRRYLDYIMIKVILEADVNDTIGLSRHKFPLKQRFFWPECSESLVDNISTEVAIIINPDTVQPIEAVNLVCSQPNAEAVICFTRCRIGDFIMLAHSYAIAQIAFFTKDTTSGKSFIAYRLPVNTAATELRHNLLEWRQFSKYCDESEIHVDDVDSIYSIITIFDWSETDYVVATCNALSHV